EGPQQRDRDRQHATGCPRLRMDGLLPPGRAHRDRRHARSLHASSGTENRGLHHRALRVGGTPSMQRHFHEELESLKQTLLAMGGLVEEQIRQVMRALVERDDALAQSVVERDQQVTPYDIEGEGTCVNPPPLPPPAAGDLRFIPPAMKIVTDLERMGDQAVNIAQRVLELNQEPQLKPYIDLPRMAE